MKYNAISILIFIGLILTSCLKPQPVSSVEYMTYIENPKNGICVHKRIGGFEFGLLYKPIDYVIALEARNGIIDLDSLSSRKKELEGFQYYTLNIRSDKDNEFIRTGLSTEEEYYRRLEYMVSGAQQDIMLVEGRDTIHCANYHFERNYGISPNSNIVLAFETKDQSNRKDKVIIYDDKILGLGKVELKLSAKSIKRIPQVII